MGALMDIIVNRRSIRKYSDKSVPGHMIDTLLDAAKWAPAGGKSANVAFGYRRRSEADLED